MSKEKDKKKIILADKVSGFEAVAFTVSALVPVIADHNRRVKFKFPFWAFSIPAGSRRGSEWIDEAAYRLWSEKILKSLSKPGGLSYFGKIRGLIIKEERDLERLARSLSPRELKDFSDRKLADQYAKFFKKYVYYYGLGGVTFLYEGILSEKLMDSLTRRYPEAVASLPALLRGSYRSFMLLSEQALLKIKRTADHKLRQKLIARYIKDFFYIRASYGQAPEVTEKFILDRVKHLAETTERIVVPAKVSLVSWEKLLIKLLKISEPIRDKRKQINIIGSYTMLHFLEEAARRRKLPVSLATRAFWFEYPNLLFQTDKFCQILKTRREFSMIYDRGRDFYLDYIALKERKTGVINVREILGTPAAGGFYRGTVRKILTGRDFSSFRPGEILVTTMTRPEFLPVMKKAAAIITDEGGLTCHAAIVARELGLPCVVGVKIATKILRDGDLIEVDASRGSVKIIKRAAKQE